jgi:hypothetical protein
MFGVRLARKENLKQGGANIGVEMTAFQLCPEFVSLLPLVAQSGWAQT